MRGIGKDDDILNIGGKSRESISLSPRKAD